ncbi:MAG: S-layer homology domain-containing protein [Clostridia bacterium]|nr:S-layer homology domain-containing protein [Clostridia bacterium]
MLLAASALSSLGPGPLPAAQAAPATGYVDVDPVRYGFALDAIRDLRARGIMVGVDAQHFAPGRTLTRAEMATLFVRLKGLALEGIGPSYADLAPSDWFYPYVKAAAANGLLLGVGAATFAPGAPVTRAMTSVVAVRALGLDRVAQDLAKAPLPFRDGSAVPAWARGAVSIAAELGVMIGDAEGFRPQDAVTRAEAAVIVERLLSVSPEAVARQGNRAVAYLEVAAGASELNVGETTTVKAWGHDAATYLIPAAVRFSAEGGVVSPDGRFTAKAPGVATVTAAIPGTSIRKSVRIAVHAPTGLVFGDGAPPAALVGVSFPVAVAVVDGSGRADPVDSGRPVTLAIRAPDGTTTSLAAKDAGGWAEFAVSLPAPGTYRLTATSAGFAPVTREIEAVSAPIGSLALTVAGQAGDLGPIGLDAASLAAVSVRLVGPDGQPLATRFPVRVEATAGRDLVRLSAQSALVSGAGPLGNVTALAPGSATLTATVPGGALAPAQADLVIRSRGTLAVLAAEEAVPVGQAAQVTVRLVGPDGQPASLDGVRVTLTPLNPAGYRMPDLTATTSGGVATFTYTPTFSGAWGFRAQAPGYDAAEARGVFQALAGPAVALSIHPAPTSLLAPGATADVVAELVDAYGNPVPAPFSLAVSEAGGDDRAGRLSAATASLPGPGTAATFTAGSEGARTYVFRSPDHPAFAPVSVTFRVLSRPADVVAGKGLWLLFGDWKAAGEDAIVRKAVEGGYSHLYLEVATSRDGGFYGGRGLEALITKAHAAGIAVLAWTYPELRDPAFDLAWSQEVIAFATPEGEKPDAFAPDIEEVTTPSVVAAYAQAVRAALGPEGRLVAITYPPQSRPDYPFRELAPYVDAFAPMSYWHHFVREYTYADAYHYVADSVVKLRALAGADVPVSVIGQAYDMFAAGAQGVYSPTPLEIQAAADAARATGAVGLSFYRFGTATDEEWEAMDRLRYE